MCRCCRNIRLIRKLPAFVVGAAQPRRSQPREPARPAHMEMALEGEKQLRGAAQRWRATEAACLVSASVAKHLRLPLPGQRRSLRPAPLTPPACRAPGRGGSAAWPGCPGPMDLTPGTGAAAPRPPPPAGAPDSWAAKPSGEGTAAGSWPARRQPRMSAPSEQHVSTPPCCCAQSMLDQSTPAGHADATRGYPDCHRHCCPAHMAGSSSSTSTAQTAREACGEGKAAAVHPPAAQRASPAAPVGSQP